MILTIASKGPDITAQVALNPSEIQYWIKYDTCDHKFDVINEESKKDQNCDSGYVTISNMSNDYFPTLIDNFDKHAENYRENHDKNVEMSGANRKEKWSSCKFIAKFE